jgi:hypothetical protein
LLRDDRESSSALGIPNLMMMMMMMMFMVLIVKLNTDTTFNNNGTNNMSIRGEHEGQHGQ